MILRRLGNKKKIAMKIQQHFPKHTLYIEPFFGAGGMFFNKPKAKYNILNDNDSEVFNLFNVISNNIYELEELIFRMPIHQDLWNHWKKNKEIDPIRKAARFLFLSNFGYMGKPDTLRYNNGNTKKILYDNIKRTNEIIFDCEFSNFDYRKLFKKISFKDNDYNSTFIYCDPPYLDTTNNYESEFNENDSKELFELLASSKLKFAMSEFDHPFIVEQANYYNLNIIEIGERVNMKNRRIEILITNYKTPQQKLFI